MEVIFLTIKLKIRYYRCLILSNVHEQGDEFPTSSEDDNKT